MEHTDVCFAPVLTHGRGGRASAQRRPRHVRRRRRRRAAGAGAAVQPHPRPRSPGRRPTPASTPARSSPTGASRPTTIDELFESGAVEVGADRGGTLVCFHAHPDDESHRRPAARWPGPRPRAIASCSSWRRTASTARCRTTSATARRSSIAGGRRPRRSAEVLGVDRVVWLGYHDSGMTGWEQNDDPGVVPAGRRRRGGRAPGRGPARRSGPTSLTIYDWHGNYGHPDHIQVHQVGHRAAELAGTPGVLEATMNRDHDRAHDGRSTATPASSSVDGRRGLRPRRAGRRRQPVRHRRRPRSRSPSTSAPTSAQKRAAVAAHAARSPTRRSSCEMPDEVFARGVRHGVVHRAGRPPGRGPRPGWLFDA